MKRNMDEDLRELERRAVIGDNSDVLAFLRAAERAGRSLADLDLRQSMLTKALDALSEQAASGREEDVRAYMAALAASGYPAGKGVVLHGSDLATAVAVALLGRELDPEAIHVVMTREDTWDGAIGPMLDELELECDAVARDLTMERRRRRDQERRRGAEPLPARRRTALEAEYQRLQTDNASFWASVNIESASPWRRTGDAYRREVWISDGMGWSDSVVITVTFRRGSARIASSQAVSTRSGESIDSDNA